MTNTNNKLFKTLQSYFVQLSPYIYMLFNIYIGYVLGEFFSNENFNEDLVQIEQKKEEQKEEKHNFKEINPYIAAFLVSLGICGLLYFGHETALNDLLKRVSELEQRNSTLEKAIKVLLDLFEKEGKP